MLTFFAKGSIIDVWQGTPWRSIRRIPLLLNQTAWKVSSYLELFLSLLLGIRTEYGNILRISPYSVRIRKIIDHKNSENGHFSRSVMNTTHSCILRSLRKLHRYLEEISWNTDGTDHEHCVKYARIRGFCHPYSGIFYALRFFLNLQGHWLEHNFPCQCHFCNSLSELIVILT